MVAGEWIEGSNAVPAGAKVGIRVAIETADVSARERNTNDILHHYARHREAHVLIVREVISEPS